MLNEQYRGTLKRILPYIMLVATCSCLGFELLKDSFQVSNVLDMYTTVDLASKRSKGYVESVSRIGFYDKQGCLVNFGSHNPVDLPFNGLVITYHDNRSVNTSVSFGQREPWICQ